MKKIFTLFFLLATTPSFSQGNLQFSSVKYIKFESAYNNIDSIITIPTGKVWKIESAATNFYGSSYPKISLDNVSIVAGITYSTSFPIWLPDGTYTFSLITGGVYSKGFISVIEYNIVP